MSVSDLVEVAIPKWKKLRNKSQWEKAAAEDKKRYEQEMAAYNKM